MLQTNHNDIMQIIISKKLIIRCLLKFRMQLKLIVPVLRDIYGNYGWELSPEDSYKGIRL